jgi:hypothetical protein
MRKHENSEGGLTGWTAKLVDGTIARESDGTPWGDVKARATGLRLSTPQIEIKLPDGQLGYIQRRSGSCPLSGGEIRIESRSIGFITPSGDAVVLTVPEAGRKVLVEVLPCRRR